MSHETMFSAFYFIFALALFYIIGNLFFKSFKKINENALNNQAPILKIPAVVVEKRVQTQDRTYYGDDDHSVSIKNEFIIIFENIQNGNRFAFEVYEDVYNAIVKDDIGYLTYQRKRFLGFEIDYTAQHIDFGNNEEAITDEKFRIDQ